MEALSFNKDGLLSSDEQWYIIRCEIGTIICVNYPKEICLFYYLLVKAANMSLKSLKSDLPMNDLSAK